MSVRKILLNDQLLLHCCILVRKDFLPFSRANHRQSHPCFEVGLVETGKYPISVVRFKLSVNILFISWVDKADTTTTIIIVTIFIVDSYNICSHMKSCRFNQNESVHNFNHCYFSINNNSSGLFTFEVDGQLLGDTGEVEGDFWVSRVGFSFFKGDVKVVCEWAALDDCSPSLCSFLC